MRKVFVLQILYLEYVYLYIKLYIFYARRIMLFSFYSRKDSTAAIKIPQIRRKHATSAGSLGAWLYK